MRYIPSNMRLKLNAYTVHERGLSSAALGSQLQNVELVQEFSETNVPITYVSSALRIVQGNRPSPCARLTHMLCFVIVQVCLFASTTVLTYRIQGIPASFDQAST